MYDVVNNWKMYIYSPPSFLGNYQMYNKYFFERFVVKIMTWLKLGIYIYVEKYTFLKFII